MKKIQMNKLNKKNASKNSLNLTSHISPRTSQKGITLPSLIIYITIMFVVLALVMRVAITFKRNLQDVTDVTFETEFEKFNMYMLDETNKTGNDVSEISETGDSIIFSDGNKFEYIKEGEEEKGEIYFNDIKLCENISACTFATEDNVEARKTSITVNITINQVQKEISYVMPLIIGVPRLPDEYQEVEYIGSSGTQYIKTGVLTNNGIIEQYTEIQISKLSKRQLTGQNNGWWFGITATNYYEGGGTTNIMPSENSFDRIVYTTNYVNNSATMTINETAKFQRTDSDMNSGLNKEIYIFNINNFSNASMTAKIKSFRITVNNELVRDYVPCYRKSDEEIGLYDLVNGRFYTNQGTGEFSKGENANNIIAITTEQEDEKNYIIDKSKLPKAYQEVEYIESTGTQYINSSVKSNLALKVEITAQINDTINSKNLGLFGGWTGTAYAQLCSNSSTAGWIVQWGSAWSHYGTKDTNKHTHLLDLPNREYTIDDTTYTISTAITSTTNADIFICAVNSAGTPARITALKLWGCKMWNNEILERDFIPCYRKSDHKRPSC